MVREAGLEPARRKTPDPKSGASANFATRAEWFIKLHHKITKST